MAAIDVMASLYLISQGENGPIKIGIAKNTTSRLGALQTGNPMRLKIVKQIRFGSYRDAQIAEGAMHKDFERRVKRLSGEWFLIDEESALDLFNISAAWFDHRFNDLRREAAHG